MKAKECLLTFVSEIKTNQEMKMDSSNVSMTILAFTRFSGLLI